MVDSSTGEVGRAQSSSVTTEEVLHNVPSHLHIKVLYHDNDVVVIDKPNDLRSVPGHASNLPSQQSNSSNTTKLTTQQAWVKAIELLGEEDTHTSNEDKHNEKVAIEELAVMEIIHNLGSTTSNTAGVPRKLETFIKYCHRNSRRLLPTYPDLHSWGSKDVGVSKDKSSEPPKKKQKHDKREIPAQMRNIAQICFAKIQQKQRPLLNLPKPTEDWESATGQLHLLGFGEYSHWVSSSSPSTGNMDVKSNKKLYVVHRLDCQTSGILVVARNQESASLLCRAWRDRDVVKKVYLAHVKSWPPYHEHKVNEGTIDIPLAASRTERIIWEKRPISDGGKESKTYWKMHEDLDEENEDIQQREREKKGVILELHPITGRTHQLRIHCAEVGSGIVGDSLYGDNPIEWRGNEAKLDTKQEGTKQQVIEDASIPKTLRLHAHKLTFPHPKSGENVTFESLKSWSSI